MVAMTAMIALMSLIAQSGWDLSSQSPVQREYQTKAAAPKEANFSYGNLLLDMATK
jgi:hypothetical protein